MSVRECAMMRDADCHYDHWLEIRRELVLFPKIFRQFSEFAPTKYSGDFGIQREIRPKFGNSSRRICDQISKYTRLQVTISLHIRNWVLVSYGGIMGQLRGDSGGARSMARTCIGRGGIQSATAVLQLCAHGSVGKALARAKGRGFNSTYE